MQTLTYGYLKPQTGDKGSVFFPALEFDIQQLNDHAHNGINSAPIASGNIVATTQNLSAASWVSVGGGTYRQLVTMPGSLQYDNFIIGAKIDSSEDQFYPTLEKVTANTFYIYINDNSKDVTVYYR